MAYHVAGSLGLSPCNLLPIASAGLATLIQTRRLKLAKHIIQNTLVVRKTIKMGPSVQLSFKKAR